MRISERRIGDVAVLDLASSLTGWTAARAMEEAVRRHRQAGTRTVVANFRQVSSVDLAGLAALVNGYSAMREAGGEMRIAGLNRIHDLVVMTRLLTVFDTFESVERAIEGPIPACSAVDGSTWVSAPVRGMFQRLRRA
jgi:anti-sigma B factor antagonist